MNHSNEDLLRIISETLEKEQFIFQPEELFEPIAYTMSLGGKRIRPLMTLMSCQMFGGKLEDALYPAIGLEVFHNFTLIHDDILDNASIRRGKPSVFKKWNTNIAILSGDTMFALSLNYFFKTSLNYTIDVLKIFNRTAIDVCRGQQYDMNFETQPYVKISDYIEMIRLKTAVLLGACVEVGAVVGNASNSDTKLAYDFAENLGIAFQLKDDILDVYSNQDVFGKKTGGDIIANKKTYLYLKAIELSDKKQKEELTHWFNLTETDDKQKIESVKNIYNSIGIKEYTEAEIKIYLEKAINSLNAISVDYNKKTAFLQFAEELMKREK